MENDNLRLEFVEESISRSLDILSKLRVEYSALGRAIQHENEKLKMYELARSKIVPVTIETALEAIRETGENSIGYKWLQEKSRNGSWADSGLRSDGSYWPHTNQYVLTVWANHSWDDTKLVVQERLIREVLPLIKSGSKGSATYIRVEKETFDLNEMRLFDIFDRGLSEYHSYKLAAVTDERWMIVESRWNDVRKEGSLMDCLRYIRDNLYYE